MFVISTKSVLYVIQSVTDLETVHQIEYSSSTDNHLSIYQFHLIIIFIQGLFLDNGNRKQFVRVCDVQFPHRTDDFMTNSTNIN